MEKSLIVRCGGKVVLERKEEVTKQVTVKSRWHGNLEKTRKAVVDKIAGLIIPATLGTRIFLSYHSPAFAQAREAAEQIRVGFQQVLDVFTAIAEPILWFYALTACILMATKNKDEGWKRLKQVGYAYTAIALLPTFFSLLRWIANLLRESLTF
jgi:hypothetical protein